jgi:hypothetical protein
MGHQHDVDSLEALQATLAWSRIKQRAKRWLLAVPVLAIVIGISCFGVSQQTLPKHRHPVLLGPWMLKIDRP